VSISAQARLCFARGNFLFRIWDEFMTAKCLARWRTKTGGEVAAMRRRSEIFRESALV
jgi:hypothetical protein